LPPNARQPVQTVERLEITHLGAQGDGVAGTARGPIYVPFTAPGDVIQARLGPGPRGTLRAELERLLEPSPERIAPACRHFGTCGGCALQHVAPEVYRRWIVERLQTALGHHGFTDPPIAEPAVSPPGSRRRLVLHAFRTASSILLGFHRRRTHRLVDIAECPVARPELVRLLPSLRDTLALCQEANEALGLTLTATAGGVDLCVEAKRPPGLEEREALAALASAADLAAVHWSDSGELDPITVRRPPVMAFGGVDVPFPPGAFAQATMEGEAALQAAVRDWTAGTGAVADLFAGLGSLSLPLASAHPLHAVEGAASLCDALRHAARAQGLKRMTVSHRDLFRRPLEAGELDDFEAVIFDPPRAGAKAQVAEFAKSHVARVIAVSCNPNTFARDARSLAEAGYRLAEIRPVDQFLWSGHLELAALFLR